MKNAWIFALLLSSIVGGGAIAGAIAMDTADSPAYVTQDEVVGEISPLGDGVCVMEGERHQYMNMLGDIDQDQTRQRERDQDGECDQDQLKQQDRLQDRQRNRTHDGECDKDQFRYRNQDQDGEQYQYREQNVDDGGEYKHQLREKKGIGCIEGP